MFSRIKRVLVALLAIALLGGAVALVKYGGAWWLRTVADVLNVDGAIDGGERFNTLPVYWVTVIIVAGPFAVGLWTLFNLEALFSGSKTLQRIKIVSLVLAGTYSAALSAAALGGRVSGSRDKRLNDRISGVSENVATFMHAAVTSMLISVAVLCVAALVWFVLDRRHRAAQAAQATPATPRTDAAHRLRRGLLSAAVVASPFVSAWFMGATNIYTARL